MAHISTIYRDLKPENLLLRKDMHLMIGDFGSGMLISLSMKKFDLKNKTLNFINKFFSKNSAK